LKHKFEKAAHKSFGIILALAVIPAAIVLVIIWFATGLGGKAADIIAGVGHEKEENYKSDF